MAPQVRNVAFTFSSLRMRKIRQIAVCGPYSHWVYSSWSRVPSGSGRTSSPPWKSKVSVTATLAWFGQTKGPPWWWSCNMIDLLHAHETLNEAAFKVHDRGGGPLISQ